MIRDHYFMEDSDHPNQCKVHVPVWEDGQIVSTCCGYSREEHNPFPNPNLILRICPRCEHQEYNALNNQCINCDYIGTIRNQ